MSKGIGKTQRFLLDSLPDKEWYVSQQIKDVRDSNFEAIDDCDIFILVCHPLLAKKYNGANIELGYAIAKGKRVYYWGTLERSAMYVGVEEISFGEIDISSSFKEG